MLLLRNKVLTALATIAFAALIGLATLANAANAAELVVFGSARCPYCIAFEREIGRDYSKSAEAGQAPLRRVNLDARRPADLSRLKGSRAHPPSFWCMKAAKWAALTGTPASGFSIPNCGGFWPGCIRRPDPEGGR